MLRELALIVCILCASRSALWIVCWLDRRSAGAAEFSRKLLHVAMGLILCPLPWLFHRPAPVIALCGVYIALLIARRYLAALDNHVGAIIDGVGRRSIGEFLFPVAVALLFVAASGDRASYLAPLLVLTLADAAAAVVGKRYGTCHYAAPGGCKSIEGSLAFAAVAFASTHLTLLLLGTAGRLESVLTALVVALILTIVEAVVTGGWDNLLVPAAAWLLLRLLGGATPIVLAACAAGALAALLALTLTCTLRFNAPRRWDSRPY